MQDVGEVIDDIQYALVPGDFFGVDGLILGNRRSVTCTAASKIVAIRILIFTNLKGKTEIIAVGLIHLFIT